MFSVKKQRGKHVFFKPQKEEKLWCSSFACCFPTLFEVALSHDTVPDIYTVFYNLFIISCSQAPMGEGLGTDNPFTGEETVIEPS